MKWVSALSKQTDIDAAVQEAAEEIIRQLGKDQADLTVVFVAPQYKDFYDKIPDLVNRYLNPDYCLVVLAEELLGTERKLNNRQPFSITCASLPV